jgi:hypothetical protein
VRHRSHQCQKNNQNQYKDIYQIQVQVLFVVFIQVLVLVPVQTQILIQAQTHSQSPAGSWTDVVLAACRDKSRDKRNFKVLYRIKGNEIRDGRGFERFHVVKGDVPDLFSPHGIALWLAALA